MAAAKPAAAPASTTGASAGAAAAGAGAGAGASASASASGNANAKPNGGKKMKLECSCRCGAVAFSILSSCPVPYMRCYCLICAKTNGSGGYGINLGGEYKSLNVTKGKDKIKDWQLQLPTGQLSHNHRTYCSVCQSYLWCFNPDWPSLIHPFASVVDTPLPPAPELVHIMLKYKANWVPVQKLSPNDQLFDEYPTESIEQWHKKRNLWLDDE